MPLLQILTRHLAALLAVVFLATTPLSATGQPVALEEGKQYLRLKSPQPMEAGKKIEVIEFFSYGCHFCSEFEPALQGWLKTMPADVQFRRIPVMFQERWIALAKIYYTLEALGEESRLSPDVFVAVHAKALPLWQEKTFFDWAASQGLDRKKVEDAYNSFAIGSKLKRAVSAAQSYQIQGVPTVAVDGKFVTHNVSSHRAMLAVIGELIAKARAERPKG